MFMLTFGWWNWRQRLCEGVSYIDSVLADLSNCYQALG